MTRPILALIAVLGLSCSAFAQQGPAASGNAQQSTVGLGQSNEKDPIGLTPTQRQMIAWSIAGAAEKQKAPAGFQPSTSAKLPDALKAAQIPASRDQVADPVRSYQYVMLEDQNLLLVGPDRTIVDVIHLDRRL